MKPVNIGFGNYIISERVAGVISPDSAPLKRLIQDARDKGAVVDATFGRRTRAIIFLDSGHTVLSALTPDTIAGRLE